MIRDKVVWAAILASILLAIPLAFAVTYPQAEISYIISPHVASGEHYNVTEYPLIIDHGNGTVDLIIYPRSAAGYRYPVTFENEPVYYEGLMTTDGIIAVSDISITNWSPELHVNILPASNGTGHVNIMAVTTLGYYHVNGTIKKPLAIKPLNYTLGYTAKVDNGRIEVFDGCYWKVAMVQERVEPFYVIAKIEIDRPAQTRA